MGLSIFLITLAGMVLNIARFFFEEKPTFWTGIYIKANIILTLYFIYSFGADRSEINSINNAIKKSLAESNNNYKTYDEMLLCLRSMKFDESKYSQSVAELLKDQSIKESNITLYDMTSTMPHNCIGYSLTHKAR